ncbi:MAG TPA: DUF1579 domain-containing protein [Terriglobia bacterium]|nr:DUF1579 domain-containing protein [Terriglobia bacterium]
MRTAFPGFPPPRFNSGLCLAGAFILSLSLATAAQQPVSNSADIQREAMHKLAFLAGRWSGPVTIMRGPGEPLHLTQSEDVQYKLDGLVVLIEGKSTSTDGKAQFSALATISFDDATRTYRIRAFNDGHYLDAELALLADGFSWGFPAGPVRIVNTMHLTAKGEWHEVSEATMGNAPPRGGVEMLLQHLR